jgi:2-dehydro-3-deoxyphosphogluconate aldolase / (4S)-4-hydroxy-2-oxoglutarate aldolase
LKNETSCARRPSASRSSGNSPRANVVAGPALDLPTIEACRILDVPVFPGAMTPTEVLTAWRAGADAVKVFPANAVGGATYLKSLIAPFPQIELISTGGVSLKNIGEFIQAGALAVGVGADLVKGDAASISAKVREYVAAVQAARSAR